MQCTKPSSKMVKVWKLGLTSYDTALKIQSALARKILNAIAKGMDVDYDTILLVEHKPVYTVGEYIILYHLFVG